MGDEQPSLELPPIFRRKKTSATVEPPIEPPRSPAPPQRSDRGPRRTLPPMPGAVLAGVLVGVLADALTWLALRGCSALRGTASCGDPGFAVLVAIAVAMGIAGYWLLRALRVPYAGSTGALATALTTVLVLVLLSTSVAQLWVAAALPVLGAAAFALAHLVTSTNTEPGDGPR